MQLRKASVHGLGNLGFGVTDAMGLDSAAKVRFVIDIHRLRVHACIGAQNEEQVLGQSLHIDLRLEVAAPLAADQVCETLDYGQVIAAVERFAAGVGRVKLVETFTSRLMSFLFEEFSEIESLRVSVEKSYIPVRDFTGSVRITMERQRLIETSF